VVLGIANLCVGAYIAQAGGRVRHKEFRFEAPRKPEMMTPDASSQQED